MQRSKTGKTGPRGKLTHRTSLLDDTHKAERLRLPDAGSLVVKPFLHAAPAPVPSQVSKKGKQ